ncbi:MAG TPA: SBBP repeat-containing protein, partial [Chloroflexota bacterium]|nr:SBBP repeat-containing protein [Chloroflexota bacterium]
MPRRAASRTVLGAALTVTVVLALFPAQASSLARTPPASSGFSHPAATGQATVATDSPTATASVTALVSPSATVVISPTGTVLASGSPTASMSPTASTSVSATASPTPSPSQSATASASTTGSATATVTPSPTVSATTTLTATDSPTPSATVSGTASPTPSPAASAVAAAYDQVPLQFEPNRGQADPRVAYLAHGPGYTVYLTASEAVLSLYPPAPPNQGPSLPPNRLPLSSSPLSLPSLAPTLPLTPSAVLHVGLVGANLQAAPVGQAQLPGEVNYFYGSDPSGWLTHIPTFAEVRYPNVYPGIDLVYHGRRQQLEYDFKLQPGADPNLVRLQVAGAQSVALDQSGNLTLQAGGATLVQAQPTVYQEIQGQRSPVAARYTLLGGGQVGFAVGSYDKGQPLVIDPVLNYSTYLGGAGYDGAYGIAVDSAGAAYITGSAYSTDFPLAGGAPYQGQNGGRSDAFISKLTADGSALVYSTYLGGNSYDDGNGIAVDSAGNAYVTGQTQSPNFPLVHALQTSLAGTQNAFVSKLDPSGSALLYSTYLGGGGTDSGSGIAVDSGGNASVIGSTDSANFPTMNALQAQLAGTENAFVSKLNPAGSALVYSTYLGGSGNDWGYGIAVDSGGNAY